jgi:hypothetical protein
MQLINSDVLIKYWLQIILGKINLSILQMFIDT